MIPQGLLWMVMFLTMMLHATAQPGGGGGLQIKHFINQAGQDVSISDPLLKLREFVFVNGIATEETFNQEIFLAYGHVHSSYKGFGLYGPRMASPRLDSTNQRLYITYGKVKMLIDFFGIPMPNGGGYYASLDTLVIQPGYFNYRVARSIARQEGMVFISDRVDTTFFAPGNLPANYFIKRARYRLINRDPAAALADINTSLTKTNGYKDCETLRLLIDIYDSLGDYSKVLAYMSEGIDCNRVGKRDGWESRWSNYEERMNLYYRLHQDENAEKDYDKIIEILSKAQQPTVLAAVKIKYHGDYAGVEKDLKRSVAEIQEEKAFNDINVRSKYTAIYFMLSDAEYRVGEKRNAFIHLWKAIDLGGATVAIRRMLDSAGKKDTNYAELYVAKAMVKIMSRNLGKNEVLDDCAKAESLGSADVMINRVRAELFFKLKDYQKALDEINLGIDKNNKDARLYMTRSAIWEKLGEPQKSEADKIKAHQLSHLNAWLFIPAWFATYH